jgi:hypothetical protein
VPGAVRLSPSHPHNDPLFACLLIILGYDLNSVFIVIQNNDSMNLVQIASLLGLSFWLREFHACSPFCTTVSRAAREGGDELKWLSLVVRTLLMALQYLTITARCSQKCYPEMFSFPKHALSQPQQKTDAPIYSKPCESEPAIEVDWKMNMGQLKHIQKMLGK